MATCQELLARMRTLDARIEAARGQAAAEALETVRVSVANFGLTPEPAFGRAGPHGRESFEGSGGRACRQPARAARTARR